MKEPNGQPRTVYGHPELEGSACGLRREWYGSRSGERLREPGEHRQIGVKLDAGEAANAERPEAVFVLQKADRRAAQVDATDGETGGGGRSGGRPLSHRSIGLSCGEAHL